MFGVIGFGSISRTPSRIAATKQPKVATAKPLRSSAGRCGLAETGSGACTFDASLAQETEAALRARMGYWAFSSAFAT
jgi:hypothetical protein